MIIILRRLVALTFSMHYLPPLSRFVINSIPAKREPPLTLGVNRLLNDSFLKYTILKQITHKLFSFNMISIDSQ